MTLSEVIRLCDTLSPNCLDESLKIGWLSEAEGTIAARITGQAVKPYSTATDPDTELLVAYPFDMIYRHFLLAQIALAHGEYERYNNSILCYNTALNAFAAFHRRTAGSGEKGPWRA